ncbi:MAG: NADH-quinone oxidoreductase subunit D [Dehalococcoidia bacterium]|nr:NADH-quinone oxidoreductase subunit D [Dehalococcoidia bacterium]MYD27612.1 NADH-quinone oxidoreductase subunit D [Dehalococcoidia bacterium]
MTVNVGPQHPATHGVFRMVLTVDGELVVGCEPYIGYLHRGLEKLSENADYRQAMGWWDRTDYLAGMCCEGAYTMAVERLAGIEVPERADYIRVIMMELSRINSHFMFLGAFGADVGSFGTSFVYAWRERERIYDLFEEVAGDRMFPTYFRIGGVTMDLPDNFESRCRWVLGSIKQGLEDMDGLLTGNEVFVERCRGLTPVTPEQAIAWGFTGPMLRATGVPWDIRKAEPYSVYPKLDFEIPVGVQGDVFDRFHVRLAECYQSVRIIEQCLEQMPEGRVLAPKLPKTLRINDGELYMPTEGTKGEYGVYLMAQGGTNPYRAKLRSPSFCNLSALTELVVGSYVADAIIILGSLDIVLGEVDK